MLRDVFVSYATEDRARVAEYVAFLRQEGLNLWWDQDNNSEIFEQIAKNIQNSSFVILFWSANASGSTFVQREITYAENCGKQIIPIKLTNTNMPGWLKLVLGDTRALDGRSRLPQAELRAVAGLVRPIAKPRGKTIAMLNMKGGVGKTTLAANIAAAFHDGLAKTVLLIDADPQANLSAMLTPSNRYASAIAADLGIASCFEHSLASGRNISLTESFRDFDTSGDPPLAIQLAYNLRNPLTTQRFDLILGQFETIKLSLRSTIPNWDDAQRRFDAFVDAARENYDVIVIDAAPSNSFLTECVLRNTDGIVAPTTPDKYALTGIRAVQKVMTEALGISRPLFVLRNQVPNQPDPSENAIIEEYQNKLLSARFRQSQYFRIRNPDPNQIVRDALAELAYFRHRETRESLKATAQEVLNGIQTP